MDSHKQVHEGAGRPLGAPLRAAPSAALARPLARPSAPPSPPPWRAPPGARLSAALSAALSAPPGAPTLGARKNPFNPFVQKKPLRKPNQRSGTLGAGEELKKITSVIGSQEMHEFPRFCLDLGKTQNAQPSP